jgi:Leucine-rich repeat (LRR) protein
MDTILSSQPTPTRIPIIAIYFGSFICGLTVGTLLLGPMASRAFPGIQPPENTTIEMDVSGFENDASLHFLNIEAANPNLLTEFPSQYLQSQAVLMQVDTIYIHKGKISDLPYEIDALRNLTTLKIFQNHLTTLPPTIGNFPNLTNLAIVGNLLIQLPPQIGNLSSLETLILNNNALDALPEEIGTLTQLKILDIRNNNITTLPSQIQYLTGLERLYMGGNPLDEATINQIRTALPNTLIYY